MLNWQAPLATCERLEFWHAFIRCSDAWSFHKSSPRWLTGLLRCGHLRRAFAAFPDPEVASHMGEILWAMGRREEALQVWERALKEAPNDPLVTEAMERLQQQAAAEEQNAV